MSRCLDFIVDDEYDGKKVVHFLREKAQLSARLISLLKLVEDGICLNGIRVRTIDPIKAGDTISIKIPLQGLPQAAFPYPLEILYEDEDILLVNKPPSLPTHPSRKHQGKTLANAVTWHLESTRGAAGAFRPIGRLDKGTSGAVLCALNPYVASRLGGRVQKTYLAIVHGEFKGKGTIDQPIFRPDPKKTVRACGREGERALTHWQALACREGLSLVRLKLETGRTHQIRVHFSYLGAPLVGDDMYGAPESDQDYHFLHCESMNFTHPVSGRKICVQAPMPPAMKKAADYIIGG
ncbi:MAG: RluA family pseudouridine synthase [Clostridiales bacterium]|nr:RluA family pseudouridine synthase [Clostridiales bacterium]